MYAGDHPSSFNCASLHELVHFVSLFIDFDWRYIFFSYILDTALVVAFSLIQNPIQ